MANLSLYPSLRMFEALDQAVFNDAKSTFFYTAFSQSYASSTLQERWRLVMDAFKRVLPVTDRPAIDDLCENRLQTIDSDRVIRLEQMLAYFETFYFLYATQAPEFSLNDTQKTSFLTDLHTAMEEACEPGKQQKFENVIRYHRRDLNWVLNTMHQLRYQLLSSMHDAYNTENFDEVAYQNTFDANQYFWRNDKINHRFDAQFHLWDAHTLSAMTKLAETNNLGITTLQSIQDVHVSDGSSLETSISRYFNMKYESVFFKEYPSQILNALTQHVLYEITTLLQKEPHELDLSNWQQNKVLLSLPAFNELTSLLDLLFPEHNPIAELVSFDEDSGETFLCVKKQLLNTIETTITDKLRREGFAYDLTKETNELNQSELFHPCCHRQLDVFKEFNALFSRIKEINSTEVNDFFRRNLVTENNLPLEFYSIFIERPSLVYSLPKRISQHIGFSKGLIEQFNAVLLEKKDYQESHIKALTYLCQNDVSVIEFMSPALLANKALLTSLINVHDTAFFHACSALQNDDVLAFNTVSVNGLALFHASPTLQNNNALTLSALRQLGINVKDNAAHNFDSFKGELRDHYKKVYSNHNLEFIDENLIKNPSQSLACGDYEKMFALEQLITQKNVSTEMMGRYARYLHPKIFLWAIARRKHLKLLSLPLCNEQTLNAFIDSVELNDGVDSALISLDKLACSDFTALRLSSLNLLIDYNAVEFNSKKVEDKQCLKSFVHHNNWFDGFCENQRLHPYLAQPFYTFNDVFKQLYSSAKALLFAGFKLVEYIGTLLFDLANICVRGMAIALVALSFSAVISLIVSSLSPFGFEATFDLFFQVPLLLIHGLAQISLNDSSDNIFIKSLINIQKMLSWIMPMRIHTKLLNTIVGVVELLKIEFNLLGLAITPLFVRTYASINVATLSAHEKIESIISQLKQRQTSSADSKADMLNSLWQCIQCDKTYLSGAITLPQSIEKDYEFMYQGESIIKSFSDVSKCHRIDNDTFQLEATSRQWCGLFHTKTSSESALLRVLEEETIESPNAFAMEI